MGLFLKKRVEMPDKMILGNTEFVFDRKLGFHVGEWIVWDRKAKILLEFQSTEGNIGDIVLEKVNWVNDHKDTIIRAFLDENDDCILESCCSTSPMPRMWIMPGPQAAPKRNWTRWWNPLCRPCGRQDSGHRRMRRAIISTGRRQTQRSAPFGPGISSPIPKACRKSLSRENWSFGGSCSRRRRRKTNEQSSVQAEPG